jgi:NADPH-dependent 2,4-dienoyl-CoA reductase/sulfur reductase-like enzyme
LQPLAIADHLGVHGARVTVVYGTTGPAPLVSRYLVGSALARLDELDVSLRYSEQVVAIRKGGVDVRNVYSHKVRRIEDVDAVVLACGAEPDSALFTELSGSGIETHLLGDAYAPRRLVWATRQAYELARTL